MERDDPRLAAARTAPTSARTPIAPTPGGARRRRAPPGAFHWAAATLLASVLGAACAPARSIAEPPASGAPVATGVRAPEGAALPAVEVESWSFGQTPGRILRTGSYRVLTTDSTPTVADKMPAFLESALLAYRSLWTSLPAPSRELEVYLMATRTQWEAITRQTAGPRADIYLRIQRGGYSENARAVFYNIGPRDTFAIAGHEGWHQYTQATFREALPIWLEEGIAVSMEGFRWDHTGTHPRFLPWSNLERYDRLRELVAAGRASRLEDILNQRPQDLLQASGLATLDYYAQIWALTLFLREGEAGAHRPGLERLLRDAAEGTLASRIADATSPREARAAMLSRVGHSAFDAYFGDVAAASASFDAFVRRAIAPGGRELILQGQSPL